MKLLWLACPDATNIEAGAAACDRGQQPDPHPRQEGRRGLLNERAVPVQDSAVGQGRHTDRSTGRKAMLAVADFLPIGHNVQPMAGEHGLETNR